MNEEQVTLKGKLAAYAICVAVAVGLLLAVLTISGYWKAEDPMDRARILCDGFSVPGALLASAGWLIFSDLYSIYVEKYASLTNIYGSVYAIALSMLWLYCCMSILFYGGALNQYLEDHR